MAKIAIDAGYYLYTSGRRCLKSLDPNETKEWILNTRIATILGDILQEAGHFVLRVDDVTGETNVSLINRSERANEWGADFFVSIQHNLGIKGGIGGGIEVYVCTDCSDISMQVQKSIYKATTEKTRLTGDRHDGTVSANHLVIKNTTMPSVLIKCGFMDSETDIRFILDPEFSKAMAEGIAEGICEIFGGKISIPVPTIDEVSEIVKEYEPINDKKSKKIINSFKKFLSRKKRKA